MRFLGHPEEGARVAAGILERLRFSKKEIKHVGLMVKYHMRAVQMSSSGIPTQRAIYRYFRDTGETGINILFLSLADHLAARGLSLDRQEWQEHTRMTEYVLNRHFEEESLSKPPKLIDGHDIMSNYGLEPGPKIGEILEALREAQAAGEVTDKQEALQYITRLLTGADNSEKKQLKE